MQLRSLRTKGKFGGCRQTTTQKNVSGSKLCHHNGGIWAKCASIWLSWQHVADMSATFSAKCTKNGLFTSNCPSQAMPVKQKSKGRSAWLGKWWEGQTKRADLPAGIKRGLPQNGIPPWQVKKNHDTTSVIVRAVCTHICAGRQYGLLLHKKGYFMGSLIFIARSRRTME